MRRGLIGVFSSALLCTLAANATATTVRHLSNAALTEEADAIVIGVPGASRSTWVDGSLVTLVELDVRQTLKGVAGPTLTVAVPGGHDLNRKFPVAVVVAGAPTLAPGQESLLFLVDGEGVAGAHSVAGFNQGSYAIVKDASGEAFVTRDLSGVTIEGGSGLTRGTATREKLSTFLEEIRSHLAAQGGDR